MRFILNSAVIPGPGTYTYAYLSLTQAKDWLALGTYESAMRYDIAADAMKLVLDVRPDVVKKWTKLNVNDEALVFRLRMPAYRSEKLNLTPDFVARNCEIGLMRRTG